MILNLRKRYLRLVMPILWRLLQPRLRAFAAGKTDYTENNLLAFIFRGVAFPAPTAIYVGLFTATPVDAGTGGTEVTGGAYARQQVTRGTVEWKDPSTATQGETNNVNAITFPVASANWGTILSAGVFDASTAGNLLYFNTLVASKVVNSGDQFKFNATDFKVTED